MRKRFMVPVGVAAMALASSASATINSNKQNIKENINTTHSQGELAEMDMSSESVVDELDYTIGSDKHLLLMRRSERGTIFAAHGSHRSHGSHSSHRSGY